MEGGEEQGANQNDKSKSSSSATAANTNTANTIGSIGGGSERIVRWSDEDVIFTVSGSSVAAVGSECADSKFLLVDSGACENVAKHGEFEAEIDATKAKPLFSVQGTPLRVYGKQYPRVAVGSLEGCMEMTVTDASESLLSVHSLINNGHSVQFSPGGCYLTTSAGDTVPLELHGKRWYLRVQGCGKKAAGSKDHHMWQPTVAPVMDEDIFDDDEWRQEQQGEDEYLIRVHNTPRRRLFDPSRMKEFPVGLHMLKPGG